jgi:hypothetical protein
MINTHCTVHLIYHVLELNSQTHCTVHLIYHVLELNSQTHCTVHLIYHVLELNSQTHWYSILIPIYIVHVLSRLIADLSIDNMNPEVVPYRLSLDVSVSLTNKI